MSYMTFQALTTKQRALLQTVRDGGGVDGIYALSLALGRNYRRVYDNVKRLQEQGYLRLAPVARSGKTAWAVTPAVTGSVLTTLNVSLPSVVTAKDLLAGLKVSRPLTVREQLALVTFFGEVPATLAVRFLNEHGIPLGQAADAYALHVRPEQRSRNAEAWLYVD